MTNMIANHTSMTPPEREPEEEDFETHFYQAAAQPVRRWGMGIRPSFSSHMSDAPFSQPGKPS